MKLTKEQQTVLEGILSVMDERQIQVIGGYAGTGKSVLLVALYNQLIEDGYHVQVCAPTGKAADVLKRKGVSNASTIHSALYSLAGVNEKVIKQTVRGKAVEVSVVESMQWDFDPTDDSDILLIDEASMVPSSVLTDLMEEGCQCIFFGDHGQLPPIGEKGESILAHPDFTLETIHRNAGPIAHFCDLLRQGGRPDAWESKGVRVERSIKLEEVLGWQVICGINQTRGKVNNFIRQALGYKKRVAPGERVVSLYNNRKLGLFNGTQGRVVSVDKRQLVIDVDGQEQQVAFLPDVFGMSKYPNFADLRDEGHPFDYAYCLTCHKAQGSEWPEVCVVDEAFKLWKPSPETVSRWRYTAASRAKDRLVWTNKIEP
jgi:exodeoxyribonuclease-5